jgi:WS/DGAT/MGAT family acyltransferase
MTLSDAGFLYLDRPHAALNIGSVAVIDGLVSQSDLTLRLEHQVAVCPRYAQRPVASLLGTSHPHWEDAPGFRAGAHVQHWALADGSGEAELHELAAHLLSMPLDRRRPLWRVHLVDLPDGRSALVHSVHHCMIDGVSGVFLLDQLFDPLDSPPVAHLRRRAHAVEAEPAKVTQRIAEDLGAAARQPLRLGAQLMRALGSGVRARAAREWLASSSYEAVRLGLRDVPRMRWNAPLAGGRKLASLRLPLEALRSVRRAFGATTNDVLLCAIAGGLHGYLEASGISTRGLELTALVPVSLRSRADAPELGNRISAMLVPLATDLEREASRLVVTQRITEQLKARAAWSGVEALLDLLEHAPPWLVRLAARALPLARIANLVATSVPGPREPRSLFGLKVSAIHPVVPIADGIGLGIAALGYADHLEVTLHADALLVPDLDKLRLAIEESFGSLAAPWLGGDQRGEAGPAMRA